MCFGKSRMVELGQFRARSLSVVWPFILCLRSLGLCLFSSEFRLPSTFKESHGLGDIWSPNISGNSSPWSVFPAFRSWAKFLGPGQGQLPGRGGREARGPPQRRAARKQYPCGARCWTFMVCGNLSQRYQFVGTAGEPCQGKRVEGGQAP